jgi:AraC family transcriptional regulator
VEAKIEILHSSDFYQIRNFKCNCTKCNTSGKEYTSAFCMCFVRSGYFEQNVFKKAHEAYTGRVLIAKPAIEHVTRHIDNQPDICTVFHFKDSFYKRVQDQYIKEISWFIKNADIHSVLIQTSPEIDYLHHRILETLFVHPSDNLLIDDLVIRMVNSIMYVLGNMQESSMISESLRRYHLVTVEKAKSFILQHFEKNISLQQLADHCCVSLFHFSRIFKSVTGISPHQYLLGVRLQHAGILLQSTKLQVSQISHQCGFNSLEYFTTAYRQRFRKSPSEFRKVMV